MGSSVGNRNPCYRTGMHTGQRYRLSETLLWSKRNWLYPAVWATALVFVYSVLGQTWIAIPSLPMSLVGVAVAFYLGFKNNASYDRQWEARKIWGGIVNASRSWAFSSRDLLGVQKDLSDADRASLHRDLVRRHVAWMDAFRHQLRQLKSWEHSGPAFEKWRQEVVEHNEDLQAVLTGHIGEAEAKEVLAQINPAAHLLANQSKKLHEHRRNGLLDGFGHVHLQDLLQELMIQQGKAERIKNFPLPRQYSTVNHFFALTFAAILPLALMSAFDNADGLRVWLTVPFAALVSWVFLTTDQIGEWSENPFEGLANDVPITAMSRGIERDILQMAGITDLPPVRPLNGPIQL